MPVVSEGLIQMSSPRRPVAVLYNNCSQPILQCKPATDAAEIRMSDLSHFDEHGASRMVDVGGKPVSRRRARASGVVRMQPTTRSMIIGRQHAKGDVLEVARLAGIMAAKRASGLIPLCHPLPIDTVGLDFSELGDDAVLIEAEVAVTARTGVEMEALTAVSVAALTIYDMCKSVDRAMVVESVQLEEKSGGQSGTFHRDHDTPKTS